MNDIKTVTYSDTYPGYFAEVTFVNGVVEKVKDDQRLLEIQGQLEKQKARTLLNE